MVRPEKSTVRSALAIWGLYPGCGSNGDNFLTGNSYGAIADVGIIFIQRDDITTLEENICDLLVSFHQMLRSFMPSMGLSRKVNIIKGIIACKATHSFGFGNRVLGAICT